MVDVGAPFGKEFVDRAKQRLGVDLAVHWFDGKSFKTLSSTFGGRDLATLDELKSALDGAAIQRGASFDSHPAALYLGQIKNYAGQPVAVLEVIKDTSAYETAAANSQRDLILGTVVILITLDPTRADRIGSYGFNGNVTRGVRPTAAPAVTGSSAVCSERSSPSWPITANGSRRIPSSGCSPQSSVEERCSTSASIRCRSRR